MHISEDRRRDLNVLAAWALAVADAVRLSAERSTGLAGGAPAALVAITADPGMNIDQLRGVLGLTHPGAVRLVDRLVDRGWVRREHAHGRAVRLVPTAAGHRVAQDVAEAREAAVAHLHTALGEQDLHTLAALAEPVLTAATGGVPDLRRLCRLCDRAVCEPCPVWEAVEAADSTAPAPDH